MNGESKAVFLSYASQDAEAARRIADALRSAGVEVWFDQSELVGGDAWDQKIRKQIRECALLIPVISKTTQARREAYFRLEWKLADERTHLMAKGTPFLLPITIDQTSDRVALVPDAFLTVQWTKAPGGELPAAFCARVKRLLDGETVGAALRRDEADESRRKAAPTMNRSPRWLKPVLAGVVVVAIVLAVTLKQKFFEASDVGPTAPSATAAPEKLSPVRQLLERARPLIETINVTRSGLDTAESLIADAAKLDPQDAKVWADWAVLDAAYLNSFFDFSAARKTAAQTHAARAMGLDPRGRDARFARAVTLVPVAGFSTAAATEAADILRQLVAEDPRDGRALLAWGYAQMSAGRSDEALESFNRAARLPGMAARAAFGRMLANYYAGRYADAEMAVDASLAAERSPLALSWKVLLALQWRGDLDDAARLEAEFPASWRLESFGATVSSFVYAYRREPDKAIAILRAVPGDFLSTNLYVGTKSFLVGDLLESAGRHEAARVEWREALRPGEAETTEAPNSQGPLEGKIMPLERLGDRAEAERLWQLDLSLYGPDLTTGARPHLMVRMLPPERAIDTLEAWVRGPFSFRVPTAAALRYDPMYDPLRGSPRFAALLALAEADPKLSPKATEKSAEKPSAPAVDDKPALADKSIAVLPFENMSDDKDSGYFADGIQEDILTTLASVRELRVVSRTSVERYRRSDKPSSQIARELGVSYLLEGSVRRAGNKVRVTGQLIRAASDEHLWAKSFDRELSDIFAIQSELAQAIAAELKAALSPAEVAEVERRPTENLEAYNLYLRARGLINREGAGSTVEAMQQEIQLLQRAVDIDPKFIRAWATLATVQANMIETGNDQTPAREQQAWAALERAARLAPDSRDVHEARGAIYYSLRDYPRAYEENEWILERHPRDADAMRIKGFIQRRWGRWTDALATLHRALELDPASIVTAQNVALHCYEMRRYDEARAAYRRVAELRPEEVENARLPAGLGTLEFYARGSTAEGDAFFTALSPAERGTREMIVRRKNWALLKGDREEFERLEMQAPDPDFAFNVAEAMLVRGETVTALRAHFPGALDNLRAEVQRDPTNQNKWLTLGWAEAMGGEPEAAIRDAQKGVELLPVAKDAFYGGYLRYRLGIVYAWAGDRDHALEELATRLRTPPAVSVHMVRHSMDWWPLHDDPRFQALVNDPKNNAPIY